MFKTYLTKSYNGLVDFVADTTLKDKNQMVLSVKKIGNVVTEKYSAGDANNMSYIIQLAYNKNKGNSKIYTWDLLSKDYYNAIYNTQKSEIKTVEKLMDKNKISKLATNEDKIKAIESFLKVNYEINESSEFDFEKSVNNKKISSLNILKFYVIALKQLNIPFEIVVTNDRSDIKFDEKFPSFVFLKDYLIYINELNKYISPISLYSRLGYPDPFNTYNNGLFIKEVNLGDLNTASSKIKFISAPTATNSYHNYKVNATINAETKEAKINVEQELFGYSAYYMQPVYRFLNNEQKEELNKSFLITETKENVKNFNILNTDEKDLYVKPMIVKYDIDKNDFLEDAGKKFIFKVGLLIGPQAELYQEGKRNFNGEIAYNHSFTRNIEITIPDGYKATNIKDLEINVTCQIDNKNAATFRSTCTIKGNVIYITVYEDYQSIEYPLQYFNDFKNVINAAADFNKKNIIFEKN